MQFLVKTVLAMTTASSIVMMKTSLIAWTTTLCSLQTFVSSTKILNVLSRLPRTNWQLENRALRG